VTPDGRSDERYSTKSGTLYQANFLAANRNKRSIAIDLKNDSGREIAQKLVQSVDVLVENFRPGVMDRLGLGADRCEHLNPSIIYASASGYGSSGPYVSRPGQDLLAQALGGFGAMNQAADGRPTPVGMSITDLLGGMNGAIGVIAAIYHRRLTGEGQRVSVSLLDSAIAALSEHAVHFLNSPANEPTRGTPMHGHGYIPPPYGFYGTKDGYLALSSGRQVSELAELLEDESLATDARFTDYEARSVNREAFENALENRLKRKTSAEWMDLMIPRDIFVAQVNSFQQTFKDPQVVHNGIVETIASPIGDLRLVGSPFKLSLTPSRIRSAPPEHGQHTAMILRELGYDQAEIDSFKRKGVVSQIAIST